MKAYRKLKIRISDMLKIL